MLGLSMKARSELVSPRPRERPTHPRPQAHEHTGSSPSAASAETEAEARRGPPLGCDLQPVVYISVAAAYGWMLAAAWLAFGNSGRSDFVLTVSTGIFLMFFALPFVGMRIAKAHSSVRSQAFYAFMVSKVETATGPLPAPDAWLQILIIPCGLALAATLIGLVYSLVT